MGYCNESYGAHFEVKVEDEAGRDTGASGPLDIVSGVPQIFDLGDKILELLFVIEPSPSIDYSLTVSLSPNPESSHASTRRSYHERH
jgi:hypothetical protein